MTSGQDPGTKIAAPTAVAVALSTDPVKVNDPEVLDTDDSQINLQEYAKDRIAALIQEQFKGHRMAVLSRGAPGRRGLHLLAQP